MYHESSNLRLVVNLLRHEEVQNAPPLVGKALRGALYCPFGGALQVFNKLPKPSLSFYATLLCCCAPLFFFFLRKHIGQNDFVLDKTSNKKIIKKKRKVGLCFLGFNKDFRAYLINNKRLLKMGFNHQSF